MGAAFICGGAEGEEACKKIKDARQTDSIRLICGDILSDRSGNLC